MSYGLIFRKKNVHTLEQQFIFYSLFEENIYRQIFVFLHPAHGYSYLDVQTQSKTTTLHYLVQ